MIITHQGTLRELNEGGDERKAQQQAQAHHHVAPAQHQQLSGLWKKRHGGYMPSPLHRQNFQLSYSIPDQLSY